MVKWETNWGPDDPHTLGSKVNLATCYADLGRIQDAFKLRERCWRGGSCGIQQRPDQTPAPTASSRSPASPRCCRCFGRVRRKTILHSFGVDDEGRHRRQFVAQLHPFGIAPAVQSGGSLGGHRRLVIVVGRPQRAADSTRRIWLKSATSVPKPTLWSVGGCGRRFRSRSGSSCSRSCLRRTGSAWRAALPIEHDGWSSTHAGSRTGRNTGTRPKSSRKQRTPEVHPEVRGRSEGADLVLFRIGSDR